MSRGPRKPQDPHAWPIPCGRCEGHYPAAATWPDGPVCGYCYQAAKRTTGRCACGHEGVLPGRLDGQPACRRCSGVRLNVDCRRCNTEAELYSGGRCWRCVLDSTVDRLLSSPNTDQVPATLRPLADALKSMPRANSGLTWLRQDHVTTFLQQLALNPATSHAQLDRLPPSRTREYVRALMVEYDILPRRDELMVRFSGWAETAITRIPEGPDRDAVNRYMRWQLQRRMRGAGPITESTFLRAKQNVTVAANFINWLHNDRGKTLQQVGQADVDAWLATGPTTRQFAERFLAWAVKGRITPSALEIAPHRRGTAITLDITKQNAVIDQLIHGDEASARDRLLAILILIFGQPVERVAALTWDQVTIGVQVTIRLGGMDIVLPEPLDQPVRELARTPVHDNTAAHPNSPWVFRGHSPGRHATPASLRQHLSRLFPARAARLGTLHELTKTALHR